MLKNIDVRSVVLREISDLLLEEADDVGTVDGQDQLHALGLNSLLLARLLVHLEGEIGIDPFADGDRTVSDIRTVDDLVDAYEAALGAGTAAGR
jgi:acyl carrier protein